MLIEIHMLKNYPATNLNRDETGAPKSFIYGGALRGQITSQCLKRIWRMDEQFREELGKENFGIRTRKMPQEVEERLLSMGVNAEFASAMRTKLTGLGNKENKKTETGDTAQNMFFSERDIDTIAEVAREMLDSCADVKAIEDLPFKDIEKEIRKKNVYPITVDMALFGRMVTSTAFANVEAAMHVAHAFSTHRVTVESDFMTGIDDLIGCGNSEGSGAAFMGDVDFTSACYYIYAQIDLDIFGQNLAGLSNRDEVVRKVVPALLRTMAFSNPSGKQSSFAGHVLPSAIMVECKDVKLSNNLANAFANPIRPIGDMVLESINKLADETDMQDRCFGIPVKERIWFCVDKYHRAPTSATKICKTFAELVDAVTTVV